MYTQSMDLVLSEASGVPFWRQIADQLADAIRGGRVLPGHALPSVRQLAVDLVVSVITVKRAYQELESLGLTTGEPGRGTFVAPEVPPFDPRREITGDLARVIRRADALGVCRSDLDAWFRDLLEAP
jgi:GntR family transcriptional regulator